MKHIINLFDTNIPAKDSHANIWWPAPNVTYIKSPPLQEFDGITVFTDEMILSEYPDKVKSKWKIAWLFESEQVKPHAYKLCPNVEHKFDYIFTHDPELLARGPKYKNMHFGSCWISPENCKIYNKTKLMSMVCSKKNWAVGHNFRHQIASTSSLSYLFDMYGTAYNEFPHTKDGRLMPFKDYYYSIVVENKKTQGYLTDKIIDCFATGTIPIYWGMTDIDTIFNKDGIYIFNSIEELQKIVTSITVDDYYKKISAIKDNHNRFMSVASPDEWMVTNCYDKLIKGEL